MHAIKGHPDQTGRESVPSINEGTSSAVFSLEGRRAYNRLDTGISWMRRYIVGWEQLIQEYFSYTEAARIN